MRLQEPREFCLRHPEVKDVCDIGQMLFFNARWAWWFTAVMFLLNNTFIQVSKPGLLRFNRDLRRSGSSLSCWRKIPQHHDES